MSDRIANIKHKISNDKIGALFVTSPYNIAYLTTLTPMTIEEREYYLFITDRKAFIIAPQMFMMAIKERTRDVEYIEITKDKGLYKIIEEIAKQENIKHVGFEEENLLFKEFDHLKRSIHGIKLVPLESFVEDERIEKDSEEINKTRASCTLTDKAFGYILEQIKEGVSENDLAWKIESFIRENGGQLAFSTIVAFGTNSAVPHHIPTAKKLETNTFVLFDLGAKVDGYCSDMSRTVFFGEPTTEQIKIYETVREAQEMSLEKLNEWNDEEFEVSHLHTISESHIKNAGFPPFPHSLGHGVGLQIHEEPSISKYTEGNPLKNNSVITIEPGVYLPEIGGVRIEDTLVLKKNGFEILTKSPKELIKIN